MKQARKTKLPASVIDSIVAAGAIKSIFCVCAKVVMAAVQPEVKEPIIVFTLSFVVNFLNALTVFSGFPSSSSEINTTFLPLIPPEALISLIASSIPFLASIPYTATGPDSGNIPPIFISCDSSLESADILPACVSSLDPADISKNAISANPKIFRAFFILFLLNKHIC